MCSSSVRFDKFVELVEYISRITSFLGTNMKTKKRNTNSNSPHSKAVRAAYTKDYDKNLTKNNRILIKSIDVDKIALIKEALQAMPGRSNADKIFLWMKAFQREQSTTSSDK